jgi:hypothetical protein
MDHPKDEIAFRRVSKPSVFRDKTSTRKYFLDARWQRVHNAIHRRETSVKARKDRVSFAKGGNAMQQFFFLVTVLASTLTLAASNVALAQSDPAALLEQAVEAIARGDVAGALALFADDATIDGAGLCAAAPCVGKAALQKELEREVADKVHVTILKTYVSGDVVTSRFEFRSDTVKKAGVERIIGWAIAELKGAKIASMRGGILDRSDPQTARYAEWQQAQPPAR